MYGVFAQSCDPLPQPFSTARDRAGSKPISYEEKPLPPRVWHQKTNTHCHHQVCDSSPSMLMLIPLKQSPSKPEIKAFTPSRGEPRIGHHALPSSFSVFKLSRSIETRRRRASCKEERCSRPSSPELAGGRGKEVVPGRCGASNGRQSLRGFESAFGITTAGANSTENGKSLNGNQI